VLHEHRLNFSHKRRVLRTALGFLAMVLLVLGVAPARAATLDMIVESTTALPGSIGQFDVILQNNSAAAVTIGSFSVDVLLSSTTSVTFTSIDNNTTAPYIFSITGSFPPGFASNLLPMEAAGFDTAATGGQVLNPGDTFGLAHVKYLVDPAAIPGTVVGVTLEPTPVFLPPPGGTSLADDLGNPVDFTSVNGTTTVQSTVVPEPSSVTMLALSSVVLLLGTLAKSNARNSEQSLCWR
jgi:hypothetical protein